MEQRTESRIPPAATILAVLALLFAVPHHIEVLPMWMSHAVALAILVPMAAIAFARTNVARWLRVERTMIQFFAGVYVLNTAAELADMVGIITLHRPETRAVSLLSSSLAIWVTNVLAFGLVYWQIDRGGPYAKATGTQRKPDWQFPQPESAAEDRVPDWRPRFVDYLFLAFNTATAFSPTDALPLTQRAKLLMMLESTISLVTLVVVAARAINVIP